MKMQNNIHRGVVGESRRTETVLLGMLNGLWIVTPQWYQTSYESMRLMKTMY